ncbi:glycine betaine ABC transporter substrate-binding protein [Pseudomonas peli]|uniref:glycine betaine ABC transporter substrate-binding protein n=1 Tax=Pseudomonas peli TaxID=592361 RepID=UPI0024AD5BED|nr:glycine betaine ABC transporter substrate-binding protein [Pseudomonas peli]
MILGCVLLFAGFAHAAEKPVDPHRRAGVHRADPAREITSQYLRAKGLTRASPAAWAATSRASAQESGQLDLIWEYTGVSLVAYNHIDDELDSQAYARVKELDAKKGLIWLTPSKFSNTYALALPENVAEEHTRRSTASAT